MTQQANQTLLSHSHPYGTPHTDRPKLPARIRLKIINQFFPPDYAPTGQLIEELAHLLREDFGPIEIFASQPSYAFESDNSPQWETYPFLTIRRSKSNRLWPSRIRGKAVSGLIFFLRAGINLLKHRRRRELVLLTTAPPFLPFLGYLLGRICRIRYICLLYDLYPDIAVELGVINSKHWVARIWDFCNQLAWKEAVAIIVLSHSMKERITHKHPSLSDKIRVIPTWANPQHIKPLPKEANWFAQMHDLVQPFTVLYSGNMGRCHDMRTLLNAIILLRDRPIRFVFIGSGAKCQPLMDKVAQLGLTNCVFLPYQPHEVIPYSLTACDVSIVSISQGMEGLVAPSKFYSALAAGRPIAAICEGHSYLNGIVAKAQCGATFLNGDSQGLAQFLETLSQQPEQAEQMGQAGRQYCLEYCTVEKVAQAYLQLFESLSVGNSHAKTSREKLS